MSRTLKPVYFKNIYQFLSDEYKTLEKHMQTSRYVYAAHRRLPHQKLDVGFPINLP
jgi:hypothetical protein